MYRKNTQIFSEQLENIYVYMTYMCFIYIKPPLKSRYRKVPLSQKILSCFFLARPHLARCDHWSDF